MNMKNAWYVVRHKTTGKFISKQDWYKSSLGNRPVLFDSYPLAEECSEKLKERMLASDDQIPNSLKYRKEQVTYWKGKQEQTEAILVMLENECKSSSGSKMLVGYPALKSKYLKLARKDLATYKERVSNAESQVRFWEGKLRSVSQVDTDFEILVMYPQQPKGLLLLKY